MFLNSKTTSGWKSNIHFSIYGHKRCLLLCFAFNSVTRFSFKYILTNSPILIFLNSLQMFNAKLSTSFPRIYHLKGFQYILQSPTGICLLFQAELYLLLKCFIFRTEATQNTSKTSGYEAGPKLGYLPQKHCVLVHKLSRTHSIDLLESNCFFLPKVCSSKSPLTLKLSQVVV